MKNLQLIASQFGAGKVLTRTEMKVVLAGYMPAGGDCASPQTVHSCTSTGSGTKPITGAVCATSSYNATLNQRNTWENQGLWGKGNVYDSISCT